jgi:hypothetical protein
MSLEITIRQLPTDGKMSIYFHNEHVQVAFGKLKELFLTQWTLRIGSEWTNMWQEMVNRAKYVLITRTRPSTPS